MIRRLRCFLVGHDWQDKWFTHRGDGVSGLLGYDTYIQRFGMTVVRRVCPKCGTVRFRRFVGSTADGNIVVKDSELAQLRKLAGIE